LIIDKKKSLQSKLVSFILVIFNLGGQRWVREKEKEKENAI